MPLAQPIFIWGCAGVFVFGLILTSPIWVRGLMAAYRTLRSAIRDSARSVSTGLGEDKKK